MEIRHVGQKRKRNLFGTYIALKLMTSSFTLWSWVIPKNSLLTYIFAFPQQALLLTVFNERLKTLGGDLLYISIKRAWVMSVLIIMSPRMSLFSTNKS